MKFQFSIARMLGATAMVALTFGVGSLLLGKEISSYAILIGIIAAALGLLVLVAQKESDFYRIIRVIGLALLLIFGLAVILGNFQQVSSDYLIVDILFIFFLVISFRKNKPTNQANCSDAQEQANEDQESE